MDKEDSLVWCPIDLVLHIISAKWTIPIIKDLLDGPKRPSQLSKTLHGINPKTLTDRLRDLEKWGLVSRTAYQEIPPRVEYTLTDKGRELVVVMDALKKLGESWIRSMTPEMAEFAQQRLNQANRLEGQRPTVDQNI